MWNLLGTGDVDDAGNVSLADLICLLSLIRLQEPVHTVSNRITNSNCNRYVAFGKLTMRFCLKSNSNRSESNRSKSNNNKVRNTLLLGISIAANVHKHVHLTERPICKQTSPVAGRGS